MNLPPPILPAAVLLTAPGAFAQHQTATLDEPHTGGALPYSIEIREVSLAPAAVPNLHSAAAAIWEGQWVLLAGRTNGLHGMTGRNAFDPVFENREVWVIDPEAKQSWSRQLDGPGGGLTTDQVDSLSSVNTQFYQDGTRLLVVGGYGYSRTAADHRTYATLTAIDLPGLVGWVKGDASSAADHVEQISDSFFQVTGGGLERIGDEFQLVFGQNYPGRYRPNFNGTYTQGVRRFRISAPGAPFAVLPGSKLQSGGDSAYRRRDLNIAPMLEYSSPANGAPAIAEAAVALSGVFTTSNGVWTIPVTVRGGGSLSMPDPLDAATLKQAFQIYHCAKIGLFHRATGEMHFLLFGGITVLERDAVSGVWNRDDNAPFTNQCGTVVRHPDGRFEQYFLPARFPVILSGGKELRFGANAEFLPSPQVGQLTRNVLDLAAIEGRTVIGHIFGGLAADAGNDGNTGSSGRVFEVALTPLPPAAPRLDIAHDGEGLILVVEQPEAGSSYLLEESLDLVNWAAAATPVAAGAEPLSWTVPEQGGRRFYRILAGTVSQP